MEEVKVGFEILKALGLRQFGPSLIACPSCGRTNVEVHELAERVEQRLAGYREHFEVAVMGCAVNGPGEAGDADFGIAGGRDSGFIYAHGEVLRKVDAGPARGRAVRRDRRLDRPRHAPSRARHAQARPEPAGDLVKLLRRIVFIAALLGLARRLLRRDTKWHDVPPPR